MNTQTFSLHYPWDENGYKPTVTFSLSSSDSSFHMHIKTLEKNPRREEYRHLNYVHYDSCVEWFVNFFPETNVNYFNFEINANGTLYAAFRKDRFEFTLLEQSDVELLDIKSAIYDDFWTIDFDVPFTFIQKYIPDFQFQKGMTILSNFYKCGDRTDYPHFGIWNPIDLPKPDFHRPEFFGKIQICE